MTRADTLAWLALCADLARSAPPLSELERARYNSQRADEMARAEARRAAPSMQLQLREVA